jgi:hypothetical protein
MDRRRDQESAVLRSVRGSFWGGMERRTDDNGMFVGLRLNCKSSHAVKMDGARARLLFPTNKEDISDLNPHL